MFAFGKIRKTAFTSVYWGFLVKDTFFKYHDCSCMPNES